MSVSRTAVVSIVAAAALTCAACSGGSSKKSPATMTVTTSVTPTVSPTAGTSGTPTVSPTKSAKPTSSTTLGGDCFSILPVTAVDRAVGAPVLGKTAFIVNEPDASVGQVERVNCRYGLRPAAAGKKAPPARVEVSVSLYASNSLAIKRIDATEEEWRQNGATPHAVKVARSGGIVLTGFGNPLLVVAAGPRTVAVNIAPDVTKTANQDKVLTALAAAALSGAGG